MTTHYYLPATTRNHRGITVAVVVMSLRCIFLVVRSTKAASILTKDGYHSAVDADISPEEVQTAAN